MGTVGTLSSPVQKGGIWRARIVWPNGKVNFVGKFSSEKDAVAWIDAHPSLTKPVAEKTIDAAQQSKSDLQQ